MDLNKIYEKVSRVSDQAAVKKVTSRTTQVRFSNNAIDITNTWNEELVTVFLAQGKKTFSFDLRDERALEDTLNRAVSALKGIEENNDFVSLNDRKNSYRTKGNRDEKLRLLNPQEFVNSFIDQVKPFFKRVGGVFYSRSISEEVATPFNSGSQGQFGIEFVARAFNDKDYPVQTSFMSSSDEDFPFWRNRGRRS